MSSPGPALEQPATEGTQRQDADNPTEQPVQASSAASAAARPIYSFWNTGPAGPSSSSVPLSGTCSLAPAAQPAPQGAAVKKKRKTAQAQDGRAQGRLVLNGQGGAWGITRVEQDRRLPANGPAKGKGRARESDSEAGQLKDVAKRARAEENTAAKAAPALKGAAAPALGPSRQGQQPDSSDIGPGSPSEDGSSTLVTFQDTKSRLALTDRNRGRPRTSKNIAPTSSSRASPDIVDLVSSDPVHPSSPNYRNTIGSVPPFLFRGGRSLSRTASVSSKGAVDDPIEVETEAVEPVQTTGPKKLVFAADNKPAHSFFAKRRPVEPQVALAETLANVPTLGTEEDSPTQSLKPATTVDSSMPPKTVGAPLKPVKTFSVFNLNGGGGVPGKMKNGWGGGVKEGEEWQAPLPGKDVYRIDSAPWPASLSFRFPKRTGKLDVSRVDPARLTDLIGHSPAPENTSASQANVEVSATRPDHPALQSVKHKHKSMSDRETWADKYRPTTSSQVLGNELEARYLRDWLQTLSLSAGKDGTTPDQPRKVFRKVKRVRPQLFDGWIVDDAGVFGDPPTATEEEEYVEFYEPEYALGERPRSHPPLETAQLTNTILLTGGHGCGKTAAVYAAASELGWQVFEVYPGMGKRTGGNLMGWVGDVGKNHLVVKSKSADTKAKGKPQGLNAFFGSLAAKDNDDPIALTGSQGSVGDPIHIDDDGHCAAPAALAVEDGGADGPQAGVRQSLILIDEADIQFTEEQTFWPAVLTLIAESRRPVILTCNDFRRIPIDTLPLQTILHFCPPPQTLATAYLEAVASQQGIDNPSTVAGQLYKTATRRALETVLQPLPPNGDEPLPHFDLRHALMQMQLDRKPTSSQECATLDNATLGDLSSLARLIESASWADAYVEPRYWAVLDTFEIDRHAPTVDDELGVKLLLKPDIHDLHPVLPAFDCSSLIAEQLVAFAKPSGLQNLPCLGDLQTARTHYVRGLLPLLDPLIVLSAPLLPSPSLFLLYMPTLQRMVEADDLLEMEEEDAVARGEARWNRKTGRPKRATRGGGEGYGRYLDLDDVALRAARSSTLVYE